MILLDQDQQIFYNSFQSNLFFENKQGVKRIIRIVIRSFEEIIRKITNLYYLLNSDIVILPAMCNDYQFELNLAFYLKKTIITDYYFSFYDTFILDRKEINKNSYKANKYFRFDDLLPLFELTFA